MGYEPVLIHAGAGGVGHVAVQLARLFGARVCATASRENLSWVRDLGAEKVIDRLSAIDGGRGRRYSFRHRGR